MAIHAEAMQALNNGDYIAFGEAIRRRQRIILEHKARLTRMVASLEKRMSRWSIARD